MYPDTFLSVLIIIIILFFFYLLQYLLSSLKLKPQIFDFHVHINPHYYIDSRVTKVMNTFEICLIVRFSLFLWVYFNDFTPIYRISMMLSKQKKKKIKHETHFHILKRLTGELWRVIKLVNKSNIEINFWTSPT